MPSQDKYCLNCISSEFISEKAICYKNGGLYCKVKKRVVPKYGSCDKYNATKGGKNVE